MTPGKIISVVEIYERRFQKEEVPKVRLDLSRTFASASRAELLAHAHFLLGGIKEYAVNPGKVSKTGRHLGFVQALLSVAGWYTLEDLMNHNRP